MGWCARGGAHHRIRRANTPKTRMVAGKRPNPHGESMGDLCGSCRSVRPLVRLSWGRVVFDPLARLSRAKPVCSAARPGSRMCNRFITT